MKARDIPNILSILRILLTVPFAVLLLHEQFIGALVIFAVAGVSDGLDGYLAKRYGWASRLGSILDPLADKTLLVSTYFAFGWLGLVPLWLVVAVIGRDVIVVLGALAYHMLIGRYMMAPTLASKINTFTQILLALVVVFSQAIWAIDAQIIDALVYIVLAATLISGADYVWTWGTRAYHAHVQREEK